MLHDLAFFQNMSADGVQVFYDHRNREFEFVAPRDS